MKRLTDSQILDALKRLNWHYGRGEVTSATFHHSALDGLTHAGLARREYEPRLGSPEQFQFRVENRTVKALGHQRTVE